MNRRNFLKQSAAAGTAAMALSYPITAAEKKFTAFDLTALPKTGFKVTRLALGSGTQGNHKSSNQTKLGMEKFVAMMRHGYDQGVNFLDTADLYGSHPHIKECLKYIPREKVAILTKTFTRDAAGMKKDIDRFRKEIGTDYIDILLLHAVREVDGADWPEKLKATLDVVSEAREKGIIGTFGCSCHSLDALNAAAESPWTEFILARINHTGVRMDDTPEKVAPVLKKAHKNGKFVMGMKIIGEGEIYDQIDESLQYVLNLGYVNSFTIGFESIQQMDYMIQRISRVKGV
jgi:1-deoxyxylulose-5-phosphate synthase